MKRIDKRADATISIEGQTYMLYVNGPLSKYPYMTNLSTGEIPKGLQLPLLKSYLFQHGVDTNGKNTHWCVRKAIEITLATE